MDFLKHYAMAKEAGMSKEDFMSLWESNMDIERRNAEAKLLELGGNISQDLYKSSITDTMKQPFSIETNMGNYDEITNLRAEVQKMFEAFRNEMLAMHLQLKKQMEEECRLNLDSMKVYVQNEIELLCQNKNMNNVSNPGFDFTHSFANLAVNEPLAELPLRKLDFTRSFANLAVNEPLVELPLRKQSLPQPFSAPLDELPLKKQSFQPFNVLFNEQPLKQQSLLQPFNIPVDELSLKKQSFFQPFNIPAEVNPFSQEVNFRSTPLSSKDYEMEPDWKEMPISKSEVPLVSRSYAAAAASDRHEKEELEQLLKPGIDNGHSGIELNHFDGSGQKNTIVATGHIAQIISKQLAQKGTSPTRSRSNRKDIVLHPGAMGKGSGALAKHSFAPSTSPSEGVASFTISNCARWHVSKQDFYTPYHYTYPIKCRIRLQMRFSSKGYLCVNVLLSKGENDENIKWPVRLSGLGEIYNHGSRRYTQLWSIDPQNCAKPGGTLEYSIGATVCLTTSRGSHVDITFDKLKQKKYEFQDYFGFRYCVKAENDASNSLTSHDA